MARRGPATAAAAQSQAPPARRRHSQPPARPAPQRRVGAGLRFDETADLHRIKLLNVVDEFTREALAIDADNFAARGLLVT